MARAWVGTSGWRYPPWRGTFYPPGLPQRRELAHQAGLVNSIEINGSFYSLQRPESYRAWAAETPDDFRFAVKGSRYITHLKQLRDVRVPLANFLASGLLALGPKLGPLLWQLPPSLGYNPERLAGFFAQLPRSTGAAAELAARHDERMDGRTLLTTAADRPLRHALEVRHESFRDPAFVALLRAHDVALVVADTAGRWPALLDATSDHVYIRLHGEEELYVSGYDPPALDRWAARIRTWAAGGTPTDGTVLAPPAPRQPRDVLVYFDNDVKVRAPFDAIGLADRLGVSPPPDPDRPAGRHRDVDEQARTEWPEIARSARGPRAAARARRRAGADPGTG